MLPFAMGAVVEGLSWDSQTPLSGQFSPVLASVPISAIEILLEKQQKTARELEQINARRTKVVNFVTRNGLSDIFCFLGIVRWIFHIARKIRVLGMFFRWKSQ